LKNGTRYPDGRSLHREVMQRSESGHDILQGGKLPTAIHLLGDGTHPSVIDLEQPEAGTRTTYVTG
jgi:hypothetical protein